MINVLLNIGHDIGAILVDMTAYVNKWRASNRVLRVVLWPISWGLTFLKVMILYVANGCRQFVNVSWPWGVTETRNHLYSATPASIYCFDKKMFFVFMLEIYFFFFYCRYVLDRTKYILPYLPIKLLVTAVPFLSLTPTQRLPLWALATLLTLAEICLGMFLILSMGFGIDFRQGHFYLKWKKHYHYRAPTSNRIIFFEIVSHAYILIKILTLNDTWCSWWGRWKLPVKPPVKERAELISNRLQNPHTPTKGGLGLFDSAAELGTPLFGVPATCAVLIAVVYILFLCTESRRSVRASAYGWWSSVNVRAAWNSSSAVQCVSGLEAAFVVVSFWALIAAFHYAAEATREVEYVYEDENEIVEAAVVPAVKTVRPIVEVPIKHCAECGRALLQHVPEFVEGHVASAPFSAHVSALLFFGAVTVVWACLLVGCESIIDRCENIPVVVDFRTFVIATAKKTFGPLARGLCVILRIIGLFLLVCMSICADS